MKVKLDKRAPQRDKPRPGGRVTGIRRAALDLILAAGREALPNEFAGVLRAYDGIITEVLVLPGTEQGTQAAIFKFYMMPVDRSVVGTVHSHPSGNFWPSKADMELFDRFGRVHIICGFPFGPANWAAYDGIGNPRDLEVFG